LCFSFLSVLAGASWAADLLIKTSLANRYFTNSTADAVYSNNIDYIYGLADCGLSLLFVLLMYLLPDPGCLFWQSFIHSVIVIDTSH
jgi:hypothetical protein